ncbi:MAG: hypothetical protein AABY22_28890 [Nanoarchaeota archaeon]
MKGKIKQITEDKIVNFDLGFIDDAITIIIDLLHLEIHSWKTFNQTRNKDYLTINNQARIQRTDLLELICDKNLLETEGELWCINKHTLRIIGGYIELANRSHSLGDINKSIEYYDKASQWLGVFLIKNKLKEGYKDV